MQESSAALRAQVRELRYDCGGWSERPCAPYPLVGQDRTFSLTHAAIDMSLGTSLPRESHVSCDIGHRIRPADLRRLSLLKTPKAKKILEFLWLSEF